MKTRFTRLINLIFFLLIVSCITGCGENDLPEEVVISLNDSFYWIVTTEESSVQDANSLYGSFQHLDYLGTRNLYNLVGPEGNYIWLRAEFTIPDELKDQNLGLVIPYLHYADKVWINDVFSGEYGVFPPEQQSPMYISHYYPLPESSLDRDGTNTILIKVWAEGWAEISGDIYIAESEGAHYESNMYTFFYSDMNMVFEGGMWCVFMLYLMIYLSGSSDKASRSFAFLNLFTSILMTNFYSYELPWTSVAGISYCTYYVWIFCIPSYFVLYITTVFMFDFLRVRIPLWMNIALHVLLIVPTVITASVSSYSMLMKICPYMIGICGFFVLIDFCLLGYCLWKKATRRNCIVLMLALQPVVLGAVTDFILRSILKIKTIPFITIFGWQGTIIWFMLILAMRYNKTRKRNEYLNGKLEQEVEEKTRELRTAKEKLEVAMKHANSDLEMASVIQEKFLASRERSFNGLELSIAYEPVSKVSGDFYDYYTDGDRLKGMCLFDVSGHGIGSSLITMIGKNTVARTFRQTDRPDIPVSVTMMNINQLMIKAKGDIENYLTGLLFKISEVDEDGSCSVSFANAGHPKPLLYRAESGTVSVLSHSSRQKQFGAIGLKGIDVSFPAISFRMSEGDVLLCYTDGLTEAVDRFRNQFGTERLERLLERHNGKCAEDIKLSIMEELEDFAGSSSDREDDVTLMILKCTSSSSGTTEDIPEELEAL